MARNRKQDSKHFITMSVPGREDDGSDTAWFVYDLRSGRSVEVAGGFVVAAAEARHMNEAA